MGLVVQRSCRSGDMFSSVSRMWLRLTLFTFLIITSASQFEFAVAEEPKEEKPSADLGVMPPETQSCEESLSSEAEARKARSRKAQANQTAQPIRERWTLESFFSEDPEKNLAVRHPFTVANAAERVTALLNHIPPRDALDPLYRVRPIKVYPMLNGEHPASNGRKVIGQEEPIQAYVQSVESRARGERSGKAVGFEGNAGTGKTELFYAVNEIGKRLKDDKYKSFGYRFKELYKINFLRPLHRFVDGKPVSEYFDPHIFASPFTLLRTDMKQEILERVLPQIRDKWGMLVTTGWLDPEPQSAEIIRRIFEHHHPDIAEGLMTVNDLTREQYLKTLMQYVVIVPKEVIRPITPEAAIIRVQSENVSYSSLVSSVNSLRLNTFGMQSPLSIEYTGKIMQAVDQVNIDEAMRNGPDFLNLMLEFLQNQVIEGDYGPAVKLDVVAAWNSNTESVEQAKENGAVKAFLNRTEKHSMRSLLVPNQIEAVMPFQIDGKRFKMRRLDEDTLRPFNSSEVYPPVDANGVTHSAQGRYALYYDNQGQDILIAPYTLNYIAWLTAATRFVTDPAKIEKAKAQANLIRSNLNILVDEVIRLKIVMRETRVEQADLRELSDLRFLLKEGDNGISARDIETWLKEAIAVARNTGVTSITPALVDSVFQRLLTQGVFLTEKDTILADWMRIRENVKLKLLLPKLRRQVDAIVSGDGQKAERLYDEIQAELIAEVSDPHGGIFIPDDNSKPITIRTDRLNEIREIYRALHHKDFSPNFLLRNLRGVRTGAVERDTDLLEAVEFYIAKHARATALSAPALEDFMRGNHADPNVAQRASEILPLLNRYGYDEYSFREALALVVQLEQKQPRTGR